MSGLAAFTSGGSWIGLSNLFAGLIHPSRPFPSVVSNSFIWDSFKILILGSVLESGRKLFRWIVGRFKIRRSITAQFNAGNPTYEWLVSYMTKENVWRAPRDYIVEIKSSQRKWKVDTGSDSHVDYIPLYDSVQYFRWKGYLLEVTQYPPEVRDDQNDSPIEPGAGFLFLTIYTLDSSVLVSFVEECRLRYEETTKPHVTVYAVGVPGPRPGRHIDGHWGSVKRKQRRPLDSLLLDGDMIDSLLEDAREFMEIEEWYINTGIPHRRGYLLHGPPGTGKTSTVYTIAGELGLEIYTLSLASPGMNDDQLMHHASCLPPRGILLIEDIDCAFPSREDEENDSDNTPFPVRRPWNVRNYPRSLVTLSGLLNMLDGIGSEEGKIFFATTNHVDRLDPALLRPGRIDRKIEYKLASQKQARALFTRFFPASRIVDAFGLETDKHSDTHHVPNAEELADTFARTIPENEFSVAELQGYLLDWKNKPFDAVSGVEEWIEGEREMRRDREKREKLRKERATAARVQEQLHASSAMIAGIGTAMAHGQMHAPPGYPLPPHTPASVLNEPPSGVGSGTASPAASEEGPDTTTNGAQGSPPGSPVPVSPTLSTDECEGVGL